MLGKDLTNGFNRSNVHMLSSPSYVEINGLKVLTYHGTSLDSVIHNIPGCSYMKTETVMIEMLKRRDMSPIYGDKSIIPTKKDALVVSEPPDVLHMGHVHKNGSAEYHGTAIVNSGTWQAKTDYQLKLGHVPTPALLPVYHMKSGVMEAVDFNTG
jgi:DNA polymerase II small subunit